MFCPQCGAQLPDDARFCLRCGKPISTSSSSFLPETKQESGAAAAVALSAEPKSEPCAPKSIIHAGQLPPEIQSNVTQLQADGLGFASREYRVVSARVQTFQVGAQSAGALTFTGVNYNFSAHWSAFGGAGSTNQTTLNKFRTDIQLKLEDPATGARSFLSASVPFEITLSIDPGEKLLLLFAKGGFPEPQVAGDFRLNAWTPFAGKNLGTGQMIPLGPLPAFSQGQPQNQGCGIALLIFGLFASFFVFSPDYLPVIGVIGIFTFLVGVLALYMSGEPRRRWQRMIAEATQEKGTYKV